MPPTGEQAEGLWRVVGVLSKDKDEGFVAKRLGIYTPRPLKGSADYIYIQF